MRWLRIARRSSGLSVRALAAAAGVAHPRLVEYENSVHQPSAGRLEALLAATQHRLIAIPSCRTELTAAENADEIATVLRSGGGRRDSRAFRLAIALHDELRAAPDHLLGTLVLTSPPPTGDQRFDALIAGIVDLHLSRRRLPVPPWVAEERRTLPVLWDVSGVGAGADLAPELLRHGVALAESELMSV